MASEKRWQTLFHDPRSERILENLVAEALAEDTAGETEEIIGLVPMPSMIKCFLAYREASSTLPRS
jgi:hypothetical protein